MKVIIEIPKGDDRRRHLKYDKSGFIDLGPIRDVIPVNNGIMPVHYGYIPETLNKKEGDEIDVLVLSDKLLEVGQEIEVELIALIRRKDEDDKAVAIDESKKTLQKWDDIPESDRKLIEDFFSYHHKFLSIENSDAASQYIENGRKQFMDNKK
jgi:inorganic pyrophosphatase